MRELVRAGTLTEIGACSPQPRATRQPTARLTTGRWSHFGQGSPDRARFADRGKAVGPMTLLTLALTVDRHPARHGVRRRGLSAVGLFPLYWRLLEPASSLEIVAHRIVWSLLVGARAARGDARLGLAAGPFAGDRASQWRLAAAAVLITANWLLYIYAVNSDQVVETSLGYFINPLVTVLIGVVLLGERLNRVQWLAVGLGDAAVLVIAVDYGRRPGSPSGWRSRSRSTA